MRLYWYQAMTAEGASVNGSGEHPDLNDLVVALATALCFSMAGPIARALGKTGINVMTRLMGLILAAMAVELLADGLVKLFPILASPTLRG